jgi:hypothetical protein
MCVRKGLFVSAFSILGACTSHPLDAQKPQDEVVNQAPPEGTTRLDGAIPDSGVPDAWLDRDTQAPDARISNPPPDVGAPDFRLNMDTRVPDARVAADTRSESKDLGPDRAGTPGDAGLFPGVELLSWIPSAGTPIRVLKNGNQVVLGDWYNRAGTDKKQSSSSGSIQIYDVADVLKPTRLSTLFTPDQEMQDLAIARRWAFAANDAYGLRVVDISHPESMQSVATRTGSGPYATAVAVTTRAQGDARQDYVFVGYLYGGGMDIHQMPEGGPIPAPINYQSTELTKRCDVHQIQIRGDRAYLLSSNGETQMYIEILDLSPLPAMPTVLGRVSLPMASYGTIGDIALSGDMLYFSASQYTYSPHAGGLRIINVADARNPVLVGSLDLPGSFLPWKGTGLAVSGDHVFYMSTAGMLAVDVSTPANPILHGLVPYPSSFGTCQGGFGVAEGDLLYVGAYCDSPGQGGLAIYRRH